jgi:hypothetical protein
MTMKKFRLSRRTVLRGAGSIAVALPWLECMEDAKAQDAPATAQRFIAVYQPGGTVIGKWRPTGSEMAPVLSPILSPLEPVKDKILIVDGLEMKSARGEQHQAGIIAFLTGTTQNGTNYARGPSIDQVIASKISKNIKPIGSLQVAVRWATGKSKGALHPINALNFEDNASFSPIPPRLDPQKIWTELFGNLEPSTPAGDLLIQRKKSILDFVDKKYDALSLRLGARDRVKLAEHLDKIREIENTLMVTPGPAGMCTPPTLVDTSDYNPNAGVNAHDANVDMEEIGTTDAAIPKVGKLMTDMIVMALACNRTAVASLQWSDTEAKHTFPWLNLTQHHHFYQHDGNFRPAECEQICNWYSQMHLYLIQAMAAVDMGGHTLLDESVVLFGNELSDPPGHGKKDMPFMLAGNGGGLRTGRWVRHQGVSHNDMLAAIMNLFGDDRTTFGDPAYCTGVLPGLT